MIIVVATGGLVFAACGGGDAAPPARDASAEAASPTPEQLFRALEPQLVGQCGGTGGQCHVNGTFASAPKWLGPPDAYASSKAYRGILPATGDPDDSILLTQIEHTGPSLQSNKDLFGKVRTWVGAELASSTAKLPSSALVLVNDGLNTIDLPSVGAKVTFSAQTNNDVITLAAIRLTAGKTALRFKDPFFVVVPAKGKVVTDPTVNGFETGLVTLNPGAAADIGTLILIRWQAGNKVKIVFKVLEAAPPSADAGPTGECTALSVFTQKAAPAFQTEVPLVEGGTHSCFYCHSGADDVAKNALDLSQLTTNPAAACAQARNYINFADRAKSIIILNPTGQANPSHPVQALQESGPVVTAIRAWVDAEK
jgi:hypothetical protein